jgi:hypothetical protein
MKTVKTLKMEESSLKPGVFHCLCGTVLLMWMKVHSYLYYFDNFNVWLIVNLEAII